MIGISRIVIVCAVLGCLFFPGCKQQQSVEMRPEFIQNEFLIEFNENGEMSSLEEEYAKYGLKQKNKLAPRRELYLVTYDQGKISPEKMYLRLKKEEGIKVIEFNKKATPRSGRGQ